MEKSSGGQQYGHGALGSYWVQQSQAQIVRVHLESYETGLRADLAAIVEAQVADDASSAMKRNAV